MLFLLAVLLLARERPGATFLLIPPTARATGMAYAFTAIADDASANYYNAAGLAFLESPSICATYSRYVTHDKPYFYGAAGLPLTSCTWGMDVTYYEEGKYEVTNERGEYIGTYAIWRLSVKASYARTVLRNLSCGVSLKYVHLDASDYYYWWPQPWDPWLPGFFDHGTSNSWAFDLNALCRVTRSLSIGAVLHNLGPKLYCVSGGAGDRLPVVSRLALAYQPLENEFCRITVSGEITKALVGAFVDDSLRFIDELDYELTEAWKGVGVEITVLKMLSLRGGHFWDTNAYLGGRRGFTYGAGVKFKGLALDIGIDEDVFDFETTNPVLTLSYTF